MNYDFESILGRLKEGLSGKVSAMEGTVTGDILQAVAAELARIWSQEVDSVTQRGFVSTAQGTWLDAACGDYGITRKEGESDESLCQRTLEHIRRQGAGGTAADYVAWAEALEGVQTASAVPLGRGAGTVDVYFAPTGDAPQDITARLEYHLEALRPVGADVQVIQAQPVAVNVAATVIRQGEGTAEGIAAAFGEKLAAYLADNRLAEGGQTIRINRVMALLLECIGVADVTALTLNGTAGNLSMGQGQYAVLGTVTVQEG